MVCSALCAKFMCESNVRISIRYLSIYSCTMSATQSSNTCGATILCIRLFRIRSCSRVSRHGSGPSLSGHMSRKMPSSCDSRRCLESLFHLQPPCRSATTRRPCPIMILSSSSQTIFESENNKTEQVVSE